jgi:PDZ domain-containing secreted protein/Zn-dependent protease/predicted transcriptional regulator
MESTFTLLRVRGIPIGVHWSWLLVFAIVVWSLATSLFPATYPNLEGSTYVAMAVVAASVFFASVLLHELGHALRGVREGVAIDGITLWLLGGVARLRGNPPSPPAEFRVAACGPAVTLALAAGFGGAALLGDRLGWPDSAQGVIDYLARINGLLLAFNLVPALPLDGGRVLRAWLWHRQQSFTAATRSAARVGQGFGFMLVAIGLLGLFDGSGRGGIWFVFLGWYLLQAAQAEATQAELRRALAGAKVRDVMTRDPMVVSPETPVADLFDRVRPGDRFSSYPVVEGDRPVGLVSLRMAAALPRSERETQTVAEVMKPLDRVPTTAPDQDVIEVLSKLDADSSRAIVTEGDRLVGVLSGPDVLRAVEMGALPGRPEQARRAGVLVWAVVTLVLLIAGAALYHPPYVVISPGEATDASGDIRIEGTAVTPVNGRYLLTSVRLSQPSALRVLVAGLRPDREVLHVSAVVPRGVEPGSYVERQRDVFRESQMLAAVAAARSQGLPVSLTGTGVRIVDVLRGSPAAETLRVGDVIVAVDGDRVTDAPALAQAVASRPAGTRFRLTVERGSERFERDVTTRRLPQLSGGVGLGVTVDTRGLDVDLPFQISFAERNVGGPSAGLAYALAIADMLSARDYAGGRVIATTGTIDADGDVGPVGGVEQKAVAAEGAGAELFLVPANEVDAARDAEASVHGVETLREALDVLSAA